MFSLLWGKYIRMQQQLIKLEGTFGTIGALMTWTECPLRMRARPGSQCALRCEPWIGFNLWFVLPLHTQKNISFFLTKISRCKSIYFLWKELKVYMSRLFSRLFSFYKKIQTFPQPNNNTASIQSFGAQFIIPLAALPVGVYQSFVLARSKFFSHSAGTLGIVNFYVNEVRCKQRSKVS